MKAVLIGGTGYGGAASLMQELTQATLTLRTGGGRRDSL